LSTYYFSMQTKLYWHSSKWDFFSNEDFNCVRRGETTA
jgi:hypothetical protein